MLDITFVTGNKNKIAELKSFFGEEVEIVDIDLDEIQESDSHKVSEHKARQAFEMLKKPVVTWDTSVSFSSLNGFPGPLVKWFWTKVGLQRICDMVYLLNDNRVSMELIFTYFDGLEIRYFTKTQEGTISREPRQVNSWGWDAIFIPNGSKLTFSEMSAEQVAEYRIISDPLNELKDFVEGLDSGR